MTTVASMTGSPDDPAWQVNRAALLSRLRRVKGQIRGIRAMIEREDECEKVAQQNDWKTSLLQSSQPRFNLRSHARIMW